MSLTLDDGVTTITLPDDLEWIDEYDHDPIGQDIQPMIGGGMIISENNITSGRLITLVSRDGVWVLKSILDAVIVFKNTIDKQMTLTLPDARTFTVMFDRSSAPVEAVQLFEKRLPLPDDYYTLTLKLLEV